MPDPNEYADEKEWMGACIPKVLEDGTAESQDQAVAICASMWSEKSADAKAILERLTAAKMGARNNANDKAAIREIRQHAKAIHDKTVDLEPDDEDKPKEEKSLGAQPMKAFFGEDLIVKAAGDWELDVLGVPFGGPVDGKDEHGEWFTDKTELFLDNFKTPIVTYYHGFDDAGPQGKPAIIGKVEKIWKDIKGWWYRIALDKTSKYASRVWEAAKSNAARASSGSIEHIARIIKGGKEMPYYSVKAMGHGGEITVWPVAEMALFDTWKGKRPANGYAVALPAMKALYQQAGIDLPLPDDDPQGAGLVTTKGVKEMDENEVSKLVAAELEKAEKARAAKAEAEKAEQEKIEAAVKAATEKVNQEWAAKNRLPVAGMPYVTKFADTNQFDNLEAADVTTMIEVLKSKGVQPSAAAYKAAHLKISEDKTQAGEYGQRAMKSCGIHAVKANELDYSTLTNYGDEWVGIQYSSALWDAIRVNTFVVNKLPSIEVPQGAESIYLPLESTDPTWYKVAEATSSATGYAGPTPTVTASTFGTGRVQLTLAKLGARTVWTGELDEGSLIPFAAQLRLQLSVSGAEYLESAIIDGDTETGASANINDIDGTPTATDWFLVFDGFRKSPLVTTTANKRSAGGSLDVTDYLETVKLMGTGGKNALDHSKVGFIVDPLTHYKTLTLSEVLTRDVFTSPTLESGRLSGLFGYSLGVSGQMCKNGGNGLSEATGKVDETTGDNLYGQILAVRWDQWKLGWRRRITMETTRWAASDTNEIVTMLRCGLIQRDTEASAITYYVGV